MTRLLQRERQARGVVSLTEMVNHCPEIQYGLDTDLNNLLFTKLTFANLLKLGTLIPVESSVSVMLLLVCTICIFRDYG